MHSKDPDVHKTYTSLRNEINHLIRKRKQEYYTNYFNTHKKKCKKFWIGVNELLHTKNKSKESPWKTNP